MRKLLLVIAILFFQPLLAQKGPKPIYTKVIYFYFGKWDILPENEKTLLTVVKAIKAQKDVYYVDITGHTDAVDNDRYNYELGLKRARAVAEFLIKRGADSSKLNLFSKGEKLGKNDNSSDSLRKQNRRVEIQVFKQESPPPVTTTGEDKILPVFTVSILDSVTRDTIKGQVYFVEKDAKGTVISQAMLMDVNGFTTAIIKDHYFEISFSSAGYRSKNKQYVFADSVFKKNISVRVTSELVKMKVKTRKNFEKIYFHGNQATFLPISDDELRRVLQFAKSSGVAAIEIVGHVNFPLNYNQNDSAMAKWNYQLSFMRAQAVFDYLVGHGVNRNIISYKGVSNTEMKFPYAKDENEMARNRRVEVLILEETK